MRRACHTGMDRDVVFRYPAGALETLLDSAIPPPKGTSSFNVDVFESQCRAVPLESFAEMVDSLDLVTRKPSSPSLDSNKVYYTNEVMAMLESHKYDEKSPQDQRITLHIILNHIMLTHEEDACNYIEILDSVLKKNIVHDATIELILTLFNPCKNAGSKLFQNSILKILLLSANIQLAVEFLRVYNREEDVVLLRKRYYIAQLITLYPSPTTIVFRLSLLDAYVHCQVDAV